MRVSFEPLATNRLLLRHLVPADWEAVSFLRTDETVNRYVQRPSAPTKQEAIAFIERIGKMQAQKEMLYWVLARKEDPETMIGSVCLWHFAPMGAAGELGYDLHPDFQGQGFMHEAVAAVLAYGFTELQLQQVSAYTQWQNTPSLSLLRRFGFTHDEDTRDETNPHNVIYRVAQATWLQQVDFNLP